MGRLQVGYLLTMLSKQAVTEALREVSRTGWTVVKANLWEWRWRLTDLHMEVVPDWSGSPTSMLTPKSHDDAPTYSLSGIYGRGAFPLHTDGAHTPSPADYVILSAPAPTPVGTTLWKWQPLSQLHSDAPTRGMFVVGAGQGAFLSPLVDDERRVRFDAGCMRPADWLARQVASTIADAEMLASVHKWEDAGRSLIIDNRRVLHGREALPTEDDAERKVERLLLRRRRR